MKPIHLDLLHRIAEAGTQGMTVHRTNILTARVLSRDGLVSYSQGKYTVTFIGRKLLPHAKDRT